MSTTRPARTVAKRTASAKSPLPAAPDSVSTVPTSPKVQAVVWRRAAPREVVQAGYWGQGSPGWSAWQRHLARRKRPRSWSRQFPAAWGDPLTWVASGDDAWRATLALVQGLVKGSRRGRRGEEEADAEVRSWMLEANPVDSPSAHGLECLAWSSALPELSSRLSADSWWALLDYLLEAAHLGNEPAVADDPLALLLLTGELPLTLAYQFPELRSPRRLRKAAGAAIAQSLVAVAEPSGVWMPQHTPGAWSLAAAWTRCRTLMGHGKQSWDAPTERRYQALLVHLCRMAYEDGSLALVGDAGGAATPELLTALRASLTDKVSRQVVRVSLPALSGGKGGKHALPKRAAPPSLHDESAASAVLRTDWRPSADRIIVDFSEAMPQVELAAGQQSLLRGSWEVSVAVDGQPLSPVGPWEVLCWHSDKDVVYLELEADYPDELIVGRHLLLARKDRWALLADSVIGKQGQRVDYRGTLPLAAGVQFEPEAETGEGRLKYGKRSAVVFPLAVPEWRSDRRIGQLHAAGRTLTLEQQGHGRSLFAPLLIDLDAARADQPRTWRQLTVGQNREILQLDAAAAFRAQVGRRQWLIYRSLTGRANRTVLGHNLVTEFLAAQFTSRGTVEPLLEIA